MFYPQTSTRLGPKRERTPEGFMLCRDVPVARTGMMMYGPGETPVPPGRDGVVRILREEDEVFRPESMASLVGKPVTDNHPDVDVTCDNWRDLARGYVITARRGEGVLDDLLVADIMVTDAELIQAICDGLREVSCGYNPDYDADDAQPGVGRQRNIRYNHLALVERGRCGPRCSIGDRATLDKEAHMSRTTDKRGGWGLLRDRIAGAFAAKDEKALAAALDEVPEEFKKEQKDRRTTGDDDPDNPLSHHIEIHNHHPGSNGETDDAVRDGEPGWFKSFRDSTDARFTAMDGAIKAIAKDAKARDDDEDEDDDTKDNTAILGQLEMEAPPGTSDKVKTAKDSALFFDSYQEAVALAEVLVPGIRIPTFDRALAPKKTVDAICGLRRTTLDLAYNQAETRGIIDQVTGGRPLDTKKMTCDAVRNLFNSAAALRKASNNRTTFGNPGSHTADRGTGGGMGVKGPIKTIADLNKSMAAHYKS